MTEVLFKVKFPPNYPIIYKMVKIPLDMTVKEAVGFIVDKYGLHQWVAGKGKGEKPDMGLYECNEKSWLDPAKTLNFYYSDLAYVEHIEFKDRSQVKGPLPMASGLDQSGLFSTKEVESLRNQLANLGSIKIRKNIPFSKSVRVKVDDKTKLEETQKMLAEKEKDSMVAAEIGQTLLEKNIELETEIVHAREKLGTYEDLLNQMEQVQADNMRIRTRNLLLETQLKEASSSHSRLLEVIEEKEKIGEEDAPRKTEKQLNRVIHSQLSEIEGLQAQLQKEHEASEALKKSNLRLTEKNDVLQSKLENFEKDDLLSKLKELEQSITDYKQKTSFLTKKNKELEGKIQELLSEVSSTNHASSSIGGFSSPSTSINSFRELVVSNPVVRKSNMDFDSSLLQQAKVLLSDLEKSFSTSTGHTPILLTLVEKLKLKDVPIEIMEGVEGDQVKSAVYLVITLIALQRQTKAEQVLEQNDKNSKDNDFEKELEEATGRLSKMQKQRDKLKDLNQGLEAELARSKEYTSKIEIELKKKDQERRNKDNGDDRVKMLEDENAILRARIEELEKLLESGLHSNGDSVKKNRIIPRLEKNYNIEEEEVFVQYINIVLADDPHLTNMLPIDPKHNILEYTGTGVLFCKLINHSIQGIIDERVINFSPQNEVEEDENYTLAFNSAKAIGCRVQDITTSSLRESPHAVFELIWEIIKVGLLSKVSLEYHPELISLLGINAPDETVQNFSKLAPLAILLRWFNFHLSKLANEFGGESLGVVITELREDIQDGTPYILLLHRLSPNSFITIDSTSVTLSHLLSQSSVEERAEIILATSLSLGVPFTFLQPHHIIQGNPKLNLAFVASVFHTMTGLTINEEQTNSVSELQQQEMIDVEGSREERAFVMWINSLGIHNYITNLQNDLQDGLAVLQILDKIAPGSINWNIVNIHPNNQYKQLENCQLAYKVATSPPLKFSLVGIDGVNFHRGETKKIMALVWQACKYNLLSLLKDVGNGKEVTEEDMTKWANNKLKKFEKTTQIDGFKDPTLANSLALLDLISTLDPKAVNPSLVNEGNTPQEREMNAKYVLSLARKIGCCVFLVWEDIVDVRPNMILTLIGSLMRLDKNL